MKKVCVFCGSSQGNKKEYAQASREMGGVLAKEKLELIYGGGDVGLMGILSRSVLAGQGRVTGIIPEALYRRVPHVELTQLIIVANMHERKARMFEMADAFIVMPGGIGTLEEFFEVFTWQQLGFHEKPVGILNISNYFGCLLQFLEHSAKEGFLKEGYQSRLIITDNPSVLITGFKEALANVNRIIKGEENE